MLDSVNEEIRKFSHYAIRLKVEISLFECLLAIILNLFVCLVYKSFPNHLNRLIIVVGCSRFGNVTQFVHSARDLRSGVPNFKHGQM